MQKEILYLDNGATTSVRYEAVQAMLPYFSKQYGNPSSLHALGEQAQRAMQRARAELAQSIGAKPWEIVFTSGGTEANNLALQGLTATHPSKKKILISALEHSSIWDVCLNLKKRGYMVKEIPVDSKGFINIHVLEKSIDVKTLLVSVIHGHNEIGVIQDLEIIGTICKKKGVYFHTDAVQSFGKEKIAVRAMHIDLLSASGHKIGGPKGIGFLYVREGLRLEPIIRGGGQERGMRGGTEPVPEIVGFAQAVKEVQKIDKQRVQHIRDYFMNELETIGGIINGSKEKRLSDNVHVSFKGIDAEMLAVALSQKGIMCSTRSACLSKQKKENRILKKLGLNKQEQKGSVRFGLGERIKEKDVDRVVKEIKLILQNLR